MSEVEVLREAAPKPGEVKKGSEGPPPTLLAWAARILSLGILAVIVGFLLYMIVSDEVPAQFELAADFDGVSERGGMFVLPLEVTNDSTSAITDVGVEIILDAPGEADDQTVSITIPLMGEGETAAAEILFGARPTESNTTVRVTSYQSP